MSSTISIIQGDDVIANPIPDSGPPPYIVSIPGIFHKQQSLLKFNEETLSKHTLLIGGTGCGKTNVFYYFVDQIKKSMSENDVMVIFDTKGDYYEKFYSEGDVVIANTNKYNAVSSIWNIYREIAINGWDNREIINNTYEITRSFFKEAVERTQQPFFASAARDLLSAIIIAHIRIGAGSAEFKNLAFNNKSLKHYLDSLTVEKIEQLLKPFPDLLAVLSYLGKGENNQALGVLAELQNAMRQILVSNFAEKGMFSVQEFVRKRNSRTLFIEYDMSIGEVLTPIYRLLFDLALKEALAQKDRTGAIRGNVYIVCDEFKLLPNLQHIGDGVNFGRGLGIKILAGLQSIEQLYEIYGESKAHNIAAGFSSVFSFRANDAKTRQFTTNLYGKSIVIDQYKTAKGTISEEKREGNTVEDWVMSTLQRGDAIIGLPEQRPFLFHFDKYLR